MTSLKKETIEKFGYSLKNEEKIVWMGGVVRNFISVTLI